MRLGSKTLSMTLLSATALQFGSAGSAAAQSTAAAEATPSAASQPAPAPAAAAATADPAAANPANASATAQKKTYTVPAGTKVLLQLRSSVNTKSARVGDGVYLSSAFPVVVGNHVMIPTGVFVQGVVDRVVRAGRMSGKSQLDMHFTSIIFPNGSVVEIPGVVSGLPGASKQDVKNGEGTIEQDTDKGRNAGKTAAIALPTGAGVGSVAGISFGSFFGWWVGGTRRRTRYRWPGNAFHAWRRCEHRGRDAGRNGAAEAADSGRREPRGGNSPRGVSGDGSGSRSAKAVAKTGTSRTFVPAGWFGLQLNFIAINNSR